MKKYKEIGVFASGTMKVLYLILLVLLTVGSFLLTYFTRFYHLSAGMTALLMFIAALFDYFIFAGANAKHQAGKEVLRTSAEGDKIMQKVLAQDVTLRYVMMAGTYLSFALAALLGLGDEVPMEAAFMPILLMPLTIIFINVMLMITRRYGLTMMSYMLLSYFMMVVGGLASVPVVLVLSINFEPLTKTIVTAVLFPILTLIAVITGRILQNMGIEGYRSGFSDR